MSDREDPKGQEANGLGANDSGRPAGTGQPSESEQTKQTEHTESPTTYGGLAGDENAQTRVAGIIDRARERNLRRAAELASWVAAGEQGTLTADDRLVAAEVAHQLAGSAGTFGYLTATDIAREVERLFADGEGSDHWTHTAERVRDLVARLREAPEPDSPPIPDGS